ncbi:Staphylocoagulase precursor [Staphylococcus aureus]|nr:Staphylocoagulase precursor [Staphylococcus aureus]
MKNKLLVLSLGALCVSQIWESNRASAVVSGEKNPYVSESLKLIDYKNNKQYTAEAYKKSLEDLIDTLPQIGNVKYDEPEFKETVKNISNGLWRKMMH